MVMSAKLLFATRTTAGGWGLPSDGFCCPPHAPVPSATASASATAAHCRVCISHLLVSRGEIRRPSGAPPVQDSICVPRPRGEKGFVHPRRAPVERARRPPLTQGG